MSNIYGLKNISNDTFEIPKSMKQKQEFGVYQYEREKTSGVEPGFIAKIFKKNKGSSRLHYVKLNYHDPFLGDLVIRNYKNIRGPRLLRGIPIISHIARAIILVASIRTREHVNTQAVMEALGNDVYRTLGVTSQKLTIIPARYSDGKEKFLLDSKEAKGPNDEKFYTFTNQIHNGVLPDNQVKVNGQQYSIDTSELGALKVKALFLGDWDLIGSTGDNLGFYISKVDGKAHLLNIDSGHTFSSCIDERDLDKDLSIQTRYNPFKHTYENFSIFDQTTREEQLRGIEDIRNRMKQVNEVFVKYELSLKNNPKIQKKICEAQSKLNKRFNYMNSVINS